MRDSRPHEWHIHEQLHHKSSLTQPGITLVLEIACISLCKGKTQNNLGPKFFEKKLINCRHFTIVGLGLQQQRTIKLLTFCCAACFKGMQKTTCNFLPLTRLSWSNTALANFNQLSYILGYTEERVATH